MDKQCQTTSCGIEPLNPTPARTGFATPLTSRFSVADHPRVGCTAASNTGRGTFHWRADWRAPAVESVVEPNRRSLRNQ